MTLVDLTCNRDSLLLAAVNTEREVELRRHARALSRAQPRQERSQAR